VAAEGLEDFVGEHIAVPASAAPTEAVNARVAAAGWPVVRSVPVGVGDELRGCLTVATSRDDELPVETDRSLGRFSALVATAVASADARARLQHLATTDGLTGLANHRAFQERLRDELEHARRRGSPLALAVFDVDGFKVINDQQGHQHGDDVLAAIGRVFAEHARGGDLPARIGGDELAIIAPDSDDCGAYGLAERLRAAVADLPFDVPLTMSAGVAYTEAGSEDPAELLRLADGALYWAKRNGRDMTVRYSPEVVRELSDAERARRHERVHAVQALRALARAVDAKDPSTREHSFRVAELAQALALRLGWDAERVIRLRDAAMLHDVGKIGVPDAVLFKPGRLDRDEYEQVKLHAPLGAQITEDILDAEQVGWVRGHHERLDGGGYPDGLAADDIPDGARLLAVADAYDSIVSPRPYKDEIPPAVAVERISEDAGRQFDPVAAEALADWLAERARAS
jgi:diguanylate cyclase (GGDEF)-like protein